MSASTDPSGDVVRSDGRRARRDRNRTAVIDALFGLLADGEVTPTAEAIAERAGVSVSSLFRYFDGLDDMHRQTIERHVERSGPLFEVPHLGEGPRTERIERLVVARVELHRSVSPVARLARARALDHVPIADHLDRTRAMFRRQVRAHFAPELDPLPRTRAEDIVDLVDTLTSFEAWHLLRSGPGRSDARIRRTWAAGIAALLDDLTGT